MDLSDLTGFLAVAKRASFTRAAEDLHLTQPAVSRQVQKLERELGVILLERRSGGLTLTPAGERLRRFAEETVAAHAGLLRQIRDTPPEVEGELRIAASTIPGEFLVPGYLARFTSRFPRVLPQVFITDSAQVVAELKEGRWDIGFVGTRLPGKGLRYETVAEDEVMLAVPAAHPFAGRTDVALGELAGQPFIEREGGSGTLRTVRTMLARQGLSLPAYQVVMVLSTTQAVLSAVERGYGMGWASSVVQGDGRAGRVAFVRLAGVQPMRRSLYLVQDRGRSLPEQARAFAEWVRREGRTP